MQEESCIGTYIWIGTEGGDVRCVDCVLNNTPAHVSEVPVAQVDGSQTGQGTGTSSALFLQPKALFPNPIPTDISRVLILCETMAPPTTPRAEGDQGHNAGLPNLLPHVTNNRAPCERVMREAAGSQPTFVVSQEYTLIDGATNLPLGFNQHRPYTQHSGYCAVGSRLVAGRSFAEEHMEMCLKAGLRVGGCHPLRSPGQWVYMLGPCEGINLGDQLFVSRWILHRLSEKEGLEATLDPNPCPGMVATTGAPLQFYTRETINPGGWVEILNQLRRLEDAHLATLMFYGSNAKRKRGGQALPWLDTFSWGVADNSKSIRIPPDVQHNGRGLYEDHRPASNMDPYLATTALVCTALGILWPEEMALELGPDELSESEFEEDEDMEDDGTRAGSRIDPDAVDTAASVMHPNTPPEAHEPLLGGELTSRGPD